MLDLAALHRALARRPRFADLAPAALALLPAKGMAHDHARLEGQAAVARVPHWSQVGLDAQANLTHQAACFTRAEACGHTPRLIDTLPPGPDLPMGALVVGEIVGRPPRLPADMPAIAQALAALHRLPLPPLAGRPPLASAADPVAATLALVEKQAAWFESADLAPQTRRRLDAELAAVRALPPGPSPVSLIGTDTHPGNFLIDAGGKAWFTDLEKAQYSLPAIDLAHASLYTSTTWDPDVATVLSPSEVAAFYTAWESAAPPALAEAQRPWFRPLRRLVWLRTLSWMARWKVEGAQLTGDVPPVVREHARERIEDFFRPATVARIADELH